MQTTPYIEKDNARTLVGTLRPSGRFSVCQTFPKKCRGFKYDKKKIETPTALRTVQEIDEAYSRLTGDDASSLHGLREQVPGDSSSIGLSIAPNSHRQAKRGSRGITSRQRDVLCHSANTLERIYRQSNMSFLTLTLPELTSDDLKLVQDNWSKIVHTVTTYLQRELKKHGCTTAITGCTELQLERYESTGLSYPHLHLVFRGRFHARSRWLITPKGFREIWRRSVNRVCDASKYDWQASENVSQVRKSSGGYLAKYVSKCGSKHGIDGANNWYPSDWILCSRRLRTLYERYTRKSFELGEHLLDVCFSWRTGIGYKQPIVISTPAYGDRVIGYWGWLKGETTYPTFAELHCS